MVAGVIQGSDILIESVKAYFSGRYERIITKVNEEISPELGWKPSVHFARNNKIIAAEAASTPYPAILRYKHADIMHTRIPIVVYSACPEESYLQNGETQKEVKELKRHGFGLLTVSTAGEVVERIPAAPLIQHIANDEFKNLIKGLPATIKNEFIECFDDYSTNPGSGLQKAGILIEGIIWGAIKHCVKKKIIPSTTTHSAAKATDHLFRNHPQLKNNKYAPCHGGIRHFIQTGRNPASHAAHSRKEAAKNISDCRTNFLLSIQHAQELCTDLKSVSIPPKLAEST